VLKEAENLPARVSKTDKNSTLALAFKTYSKINYTNTKKNFT
jgi:hypothetical protein